MVYREITKMEIEDKHKICRTFKGVTEEIKWEGHLCFNVGKKMFKTFIFGK